jgi:MFS transporter, SP family, inositol transporter
VTVVIFMPYSDRSYRTRKVLWGVGAVLQVLAYALLLFVPFTIPVVLVNVILFAAGGALAGEAFYKIFSQELFPTMLRTTAQGLTFGVARLVLGVWSFFVPVLARAGIGDIAALLVLFLLISGVVGFFFMPDTSGKSLEQIESERA